MNLWTLAFLVNYLRALPPAHTPTQTPPHTIYTIQAHKYIQRTYTIYTNTTLIREPHAYLIHKLQYTPHTHTHFPSPKTALLSRRELCHFQGYDSASRACCYKREVLHQLCHLPGKACRVSSKFAFWPEEKGVEVFFPPLDC